MFGDTLLSAGFITYLGPFTKDYRAIIWEDWTR